MKKKLVTFADFDKQAEKLQTESDLFRFIEQEIINSYDEQGKTTYNDNEALDGIYKLICSKNLKNCDSYRVKTIRNLFYFTEVSADMAHTDAKIVEIISIITKRYIEETKRSE